MFCSVFIIPNRFASDCPIFNRIQYFINDLLSNMLL